MDFSRNRDDQTDELLALQSIYDGTSRLLVRPRNREDECVLEMLIPVVLNVSPVSVLVFTPPSPESESGLRNDEPSSDGYATAFSCLATFDVSHLVPIKLEVTFPSSYPSDSSPSFRLSCNWLQPHHLSMLCSKLDALWEEMLNIPIVFQWVDWLENYSLRYLDITDTIRIYPTTLGETEQNSRVILPQFLDVTKIAQDLVQYDIQRKQKILESQHQQCGVCFEEKLGSRFLQIAQCGHGFCQDCLSAFCEMHTSAGTVSEINCPEHKCQSSIPASILKCCLSAELYQRWEVLTFQKYLDRMNDIIYCPRCNSPVIKEPEESLHLGHCMVCYFSFCTECRDNWHQGENCETLEEKLEKITKSTSSDPASSTDDSEALVLMRLKQEKKSLQFIKKFTRQCPNCSIPIRRTEGCNLMTCSHCGHKMCWGCGCEILTHDHISTCKKVGPENDTPYVPLPFVPIHLQKQEEPEAAKQMQKALQNGKATKADLVQCPSCHHENLKLNKNNHIQCWCCKTNFCASCRKSIGKMVSQHYMGRSQCKQHS